MEACRKLVINAIYACAALAGLAPVLAFGEWGPTAFLWIMLAATLLLFERGRVRHAPDWFAKHLIALPVLIVAYADLTIMATPLMQAASHLLSLAMAAKSLGRKTTADLWTMYFVSLLQMLVCAVISLNTLYFGLWIVYAGLSVFFLNAALLLPIRAGRTLAVHVPAGSTLARRWMRLSVPIWIVLVLGTAISFLFFPRDLSGVREALHMRRNSERLAWAAGVMIPDGARTSTGFSDNVDIGSLGGVILDPTEAIEVRMTRDGKPFWPGPEQIYLRGRALDKFDGRRWTVSDSTIRPRAGRSYHDFWYGPDRSPDDMRVQVTPLVDQGATLFLPRPLVSVDVDRVNVDSCGNLQREGLSQRPYSATCWWRPWDNASGRVAGWTNDQLVELPPSPHTQEYEKLAESITRGCRTTSERVAAVSRWLSNNCEYTLDLEWQSNSDPIREFLTRKRGYCVHFASTMAVLLRSLGIPCHLAVGFAGGERVDSRDAYVLRLSDAHAWVEVPYDNGVWIPYDPTAGSRLAQERDRTLTIGWQSRLRNILDRNLLFYDLEKQAALVASIGNLFRLAATTLIGWILIALSIVGLVWYARQSAKKRELVKELLRRRDVAIPIPSWPSIPFYAEMLTLLRRAGIERGASATPHEFSQNVARYRAALAAPVETLTEMFESERYGARPADVEAAQAGIDELKASLR